MKVSIIVTVYNIEKYIEKCLDSIQNQSFTDFECIVVNDGSTDSSFAKLKNYYSDKRFIIVNKENGGVSSARNAGIEIAKGKYLCFVDGDDWLDNDAIEQLVQYIEKNDFDTLFNGYKGIRENGDIAETVKPKFEKEKYEDDETIELISNFVGYSYDDLYNKLSGKAEQVNREFAAVWRFVYSNDIIKKNNLRFDGTIQFGEDILFNTEYLAACEKIGISNLSVYNYLYRESGWVQTFLNEDGEKLVNHKIVLMEARDKTTKKILRSKGKDISDMWQGSIIFSAMHVGLALSKSKESSFFKRYKLFRKYATNSICKRAFKGLELRKLSLKYKFCFVAMKVHCYFVEYLALNIANWIGISPGVEG